MVTTKGSFFRRGSSLVLWVAIVLLADGCIYDGKYFPLTVRNAQKNIVYRCDTRLEKENFYAEVIQINDPQKKILRLAGKPTCMTINHDGDTLALGLHKSHFEEFEVILIDANTLCKQKHPQISLINTKESSHNNGEYISDKQRFDIMAISDDKSRLAIYYWKSSKNKDDDFYYQDTIGILDIISGKIVSEIKIPDLEKSEVPPDKIIGTGASSITFSKDGDLLAISGSWHSKNAPPNQFYRPYLYIWSLDNTGIAKSLTIDHALYELCFDSSSAYLAGCYWAQNQKTNQVEAMIYNLTTGQKEASIIIPGKLLDTSILPGAKPGTFTIIMADGRRFDLPNRNLGHIRACCITPDK